MPRRSNRKSRSPKKRSSSVRGCKSTLKMIKKYEKAYEQCLRKAIAKRKAMNRKKMKRSKKRRSKKKKSSTY